MHDLAPFYEGNQWPELRSFICVESFRTTTKKGVKVENQEKRYYISSLDFDAKTMLSFIRSHWCIENNLHWQLDVTFKEDTSRTRSAYAPINWNIARKAALSFLTTKQSFFSELSVAAMRFCFVADNQAFRKLIDHVL